VRIIVLRKGDKVVEKIIAYIASEKIKSGLICALGALSQAELMIYDLEKKEYFSKKLEEALEVGSFSAIIGKDPEGNPHIHPHVVLSDTEFVSFAGHLKEGVVGPTLEVAIIESDQKVERYADSEIGLNLIK